MEEIKIRVTMTEILIDRNSVHNTNHSQLFYRSRPQFLQNLPSAESKLIYIQQERKNYELVHNTQNT